MIYVFLAIAFAVGILYFSVSPGIELKGTSINAGLLQHLTAYFLLSFLIFKSTYNFKLAIFLAATYGFLMESIQYVIPYRSFQFFDVFSNFLGSFLVLVLKFRK